MENSLRKKGRKPIFQKRQSRASSPELLYQTTTSVLRDSMVVPRTVTFEMNAKPFFSSMRNTFIRPQSVAKPTPPINISFVNRPTSLIKNQTSFVMQRPFTPNCQSPAVYRTVIHPPQNNNNVKLYRSQQSFYRPISTNYPQKYISAQSTWYPQSKIVRADELKPTVVAIERIMKPIDQNINYSVNNANSRISQSYCYQKIKEPEQIRVFSKINRKSCEDERLYKLAEINNTLVKNYDILYDQLQNLKRQVIEEDVINEELLMQKAKYHFQSLLNMQMQRASNKLEGIYKEERRYYQHQNQLLHTFQNWR